MPQLSFRCFLTQEEFWDCVREVIQSQQAVPFKAIGNELVLTDSQSMTQNDDEYLIALVLSEYPMPVDRQGSWERGDVNIWYCWPPKGVLCITDMCIKTSASPPSKIFKALKRSFAQRARVNRAFAFSSAPDKSVPHKASEGAVELARQGYLVTEDCLPFSPVVENYVLTDERS
jgi:hypothetical protein